MGYIVKLSRYADGKCFTETELEELELAIPESAEVWKLEGKYAEKAFDYVKAELNLAAEYIKDSDAFQLYDKPEERWFGERLGLVKTELENFENDENNSVKIFQAIQEIVRPREDIYVFYDGEYNNIDAFFATQAENHALYYIIDIAEF